MAKMIAELDLNELICRMLDATGIPRPPGIPADVLVAAMDEDTRQPLAQMANAASNYFQECLQSAQPVDP